MSQYEAIKSECEHQAEVHSGRAKYFAAGNVTAVLFTAGFAALAAVTSQTSVPTWVTTASAALSASIGIITASYSFQNKSKLHTELAADWKRLGSRYSQVAELGAANQQGAWLDALDKMLSSLRKDEPVADEEAWTAARVPASTPV